MRKEIFTGLAVAGSYLLTGCGSNEPSSEPASAVVEESISASEVSVTYLEDGSRELVFPDRSSGYAGSVYVLQMCIGLDMITNSQQDYVRGGAGSTTVNENHQACADGKLTPADFEIQE